MTPLLVASISILDRFYRTYPGGPETGFFTKRLRCNRQIR